MNEVTVKQNTQLTTETNEIFGADTIDNSDLTLPRLLIMQKMSKLLEDETVTATPGDLVNSLTKEKMELPVGIIPIFSQKFWRENTMEGNEVKNSTKFPFTGENSKLPYEQAEGNFVIKRSTVIDWYCLLASEVSTGMALPCVVSFTKTSMPAGRKLNTLVKQAALLRKPACGNVYSLSLQKQSNDKGTFWVFDIAKIRESTPEEVDAAKLWYLTLQSSKVQVVEASKEEADSVPY